MTAPTTVPGAVCALGCCTAEVAALRDGGWSTNDKGWKLDDRRREHVTREYAAISARIDHAHAGYPQCALCGQRVIKLDRFGLCSKDKGEHAEWRADMRRDEKVGAR
jgi:hypothetical protein